MNRYRPWLLLLMLTMLDCAGHQTIVRDSVSPGVTVLRWRVVATDPPSQTLLVRNNTSVPVQLMRLQLRDCENVRGGCQSRMDLEVVLGAGESMEILTLFPADARFPFSFRWSVVSRRLQ